MSIVATVEHVVSVDEPRVAVRFAPPATEATTFGGLTDVDGGGQFGVGAAISLGSAAAIDGLGGSDEGRADTGATAEGVADGWAADATTLADALGWTRLTAPGDTRRLSIGVPAQAATKSDRAIVATTAGADLGIASSIRR